MKVLDPSNIIVVLNTGLDKLGIHKKYDISNENLMISNFQLHGLNHSNNGGSGPAGEER